MSCVIETSQADVGSSCFYTLPGLNSDRPVDFFRILRLAFVSTSSKHLSLTTTDLGARGARRGSSASTGLATFTYETFTPELVARYSAVAAAADVVEKLDVVDRVETMNETFAKVIAFLQNSGT